MDYPVMEALTGLLVSKTLDVTQYAEKVESLLSFYPQENVFAMYVPLGSHDTERILTRMGNNVDKTKLAYLFQFAFPGVPAIFYGDEIGMDGGKDPACRGAFLWDENKWNADIRNLIKTLIRLRKDHNALRRGDYCRVEHTSNESCYAFMRKTPDNQVLVVMNASTNEQKLLIKTDEIGWDDGRRVNDLILPTLQYTVIDHSIDITLPPWGGVWLA
jgi:glycosidase